MSIPYEPMKSKFRMTIIAKSWPIKFVMIRLKNKNKIHIPIHNGFNLVACPWKMTYIYENLVT
jgi:hypothetical protein